MESITVYKYNNKVRLTIEPGVSLKFALGKKLQIGMVGGYYGDQYYGGELFAIGKPDSLITFSAINNSKGGWDGIYIHHAADNYGGISCLKNCLIENGNDRNVYIESDTHTTIDSCIIRNALSRGVYISNSNPKICRTSIYENTNGIYIDGNSNPRIGNYPDSANNIFNNSLYNIYNNSGNNLNMKYNYFGLVDTLNINRKIYDKNDNAGLGLISYKPYNNLPKLITPTMHSQGYLSYGKPTFSAMKSDKVEVKDNSLTVVATATTNSSGVFTHSNISSGSYNMVFTPLNETYSSVNSADALKILRHFSHLDTLKTHYAQVADVNANKVINATDAMLVLRRFAGSITSFVTGDTWFYSDTSIVSGNDVESRVRMLWFGDVNASYNPAAKMTTPPLNPRGSLDISRTQEFDYPLYLDTREILGSISLVLRYPGQHLEVSDVQFGREDGMSTYTIQKDEIRFAWASLEPLEVQKDIPFLTIRFKVKNLPKGMVPEITLGEETSFSDKRAENLADLVVAAPELRSVSPDQSLQKDQGIRIHRLTQTEGSTLIEFNSSSTGRAVFNLYNVLGQLVLSEYLEIAEGTNLKPFQTSQLEKGIYLLNISYDAASGIDNQNLKLYISK
ncbi:MAG: dockerin type I domain-containing protein [Bacteroidetes bacterium]|nr:dockerin type I domain-containing protein [Bacteroidota bacterium]